MNRSPLRWFRILFVGVAGLVLGTAFALTCTFVYLAPGLPTAENAQQIPLRIYTRNGGLISQIGEQRRIPVTFEQLPDMVVKAVLAAEDDRFFEHGGFDWMGIARAVLSNVASADATGQGGSTITQQAARNMFLTLDQTPRRKASEVFVTYRMERDLTKQQIMAIYMNVATFGHRSYGIAAAAEAYYGKRLDQLTVAQAATLVGLLPAPSRYNPISNPRNAEVRRGYVLGRMEKLGYIDAATAAAAAREPVATTLHPPLVDVEAPYVADMVQQEIVKRFGPAALNKGYKVITTLDGRLQEYANYGVRVGLLDYDQRHGYRGHLAKVKLPAGADAAALEQLLEKYEPAALLQPAVVTKVGQNSAQVYVRGEGEAKIGWDGLKWARPVSKSGALGANPGKAADVVSAGDVVRVLTDKRGNAHLAQVPGAQAALVALDPADGSVVALVGGFNFYGNNFNRAVQARRQPGSGFKPFVYSAALDHGYTASTIEYDLPLLNVNCDEEQCWNPENSGGGYAGAMRLREALKRSRNPVAARLQENIGVDTVIEHAQKFGFNKDALPRIPSLALGTLSASPLTMATAYATFANGGFKVDNHFISRIEDATGKVVFEAKPRIVCEECEPPPAAPVALVEVGPDSAADADATAIATTATDAPDSSPAVLLTPEPALLAAPGPAPVIHDVEAPPALRELARNQGGLGYLTADRLAPRVLSAQNAWLMSDILHDAACCGTAARSQQLGRNDLAGKTGTTNDSRDNWFNGFTTRLVASVWVGFDDYTPLGEREEGSRTALPIWMHFMKGALQDVPQERLERPGGLIDLRVSTTTGMLADQSDPTAVFETFMVENPPKVPEGGVPGAPGTPGARGGEPLF